MEIKEREYANQVELNVREISFKMDKTGEYVDKISFETTDGYKITYKPKINKTERIRGIAVNKVTQCTFDEVPKKVFELSEALNKLGIVKLYANYNIWNTQVDGKAATYRYIMSESMLNEWKIIPETPIKEENIAK